MHIVLGREKDGKQLQLILGGNIFIISKPARFFPGKKKKTNIKLVANSKSCLCTFM